MRLVSVTTNNLRNGLTAARKLLGLHLQDSREKIRSGGEDGLYRCTLASGDVVKVKLERPWPKGRKIEAILVEG